VTRETRKGSSRSAATKAAPPAFFSLATLLRRHDRDRYQTALFAPAAQRDGLFALFAFNYEVARVRESVTQPMLGQIRLQWWREVIDAAYAGAPCRHHEVAEPLTATIREYGLTRAHFDRLIDTRERDLADEPPADMVALEDYAEGTSATLLWLVLEILRVSAPAASVTVREVGRAYALTGLLRAMPFHAGAGRCYIPADMRIDPADYAAMRATANLRRAVAEIARAAAEHLHAARQHLAQTPRAAFPALLLAVIARHNLTRLRQMDYDPFAPGLVRPDPLQSWRLLAASAMQRF
jgi:NADH dehydrogenase [ubiquinone] 1 alpha subcomplex assembly factor 6